MDIQLLLQEIQALKNENNNLKTIINKYSQSRKSYYDNNKEIVKKKASERLKKLSQENPDKIKQYAKTAYQNQKLKKKKLIEQQKFEILEV